MTIMGNEAVVTVIATTAKQCELNGAVVWGIPFWEWRWKLLYRTKSSTSLHSPSFSLSRFVSCFFHFYFSIFHPFFSFMPSNIPFAHHLATYFRAATNIIH